MCGPSLAPLPPTSAVAFPVVRAARVLLVEQDVGVLVDRNVRRGEVGRRDVRVDDRSVQEHGRRDRARATIHHGCPLRVHGAELLETLLQGAGVARQRGLQRLQGAEVERRAATAVRAQRERTVEGAGAAGGRGDSAAEPIETAAGLGEGDSGPHAATAAK
jgi:hypothetical protein